VTANIIGIIAIVTLSIVVIGSLILPYLAAIHHITYDINATIVTGAIAALSGIISAVAVKKIQNTNTCSPDAKSEKKD